MFKKIVSLGVMAVMLFAFTGCGGNDFVEEETEDIVDCSLFSYSPIMSSIGQPVELKYPEVDAVFECTVDCGTFVLLGNPEQYIKNVIVKPGDGFHWQPHEKDSDGRFLSDNRAEQAFVEIILKINENIIGYALVEIYPTGEPNFFFKARNLKSALFPKVNGEYQKVTENQVKSFMEKIKGENSL